MPRAAPDDVAADAGLAWQPARLRAAPSQPSLSFRDRCCLALAKREALPAWIADKAWTSIAAAAEVKVKMIRSNGDGCPNR
jgi:ribonuclease VapC